MKVEIRCYEDRRKHCQDKRKVKAYCNLKISTKERFDCSVICLTVTLVARLFLNEKYIAKQLI